MIRYLKKEDINKANKLLANFNYKISEYSLQNPFFRGLVYVEDDIKGIVVYDLLYDRVEIEYIIVEDKYRKKGIGSKLIEEIEKSNIKNITLEVRESNFTAINFYLSNGFRIETIRKNYYGNENGYLMLKELGE